MCVHAHSFILNLGSYDLAKLLHKEPYEVIPLENRINLKYEMKTLISLQFHHFLWVQALCVHESTNNKLDEKCLCETATPVIQPFHVHVAMDMCKHISP